MTDRYDVVILGAGPAGLSAAIYSARFGLRTLLIGEILGGQASEAIKIENYPGVEETSGITLAENMMKQATNFGAILHFPEKITSLELKDKIKRIKSVAGEYEARAVIIAMGASHRKLNVPGEEKFTGRGVSYCATCDGPLFRKKTVAIIGGGNTAVHEALYLKEIVGKLYLIHRRDDLRSDKVYLDQIKKSNIVFVWDTEVKEILGDQFVDRLSLINNRTMKESVLEVKGVFVAIGRKPETDLAKVAGVKIDENGLIMINCKQETNIPGVYAAGDCSSSFWQISPAVGQGVAAAINARNYLKGEE